MLVHSFAFVCWTRRVCYRKCTFFFLFRWNATATTRLQYIYVHVTLKLWINDRECVELACVCVCDFSSKLLAWQRYIHKYVEWTFRPRGTTIQHINVVLVKPLRLGKPIFSHSSLLSMIMNFKVLHHWIGAFIYWALCFSQHFTSFWDQFCANVHWSCFFDTHSHSHLLHFTLSGNHIEISVKTKVKATLHYTKFVMRFFLLLFIIIIIIYNIILLCIFY